MLVREGKEEREENERKAGGSENKQRWNMKTTFVANSHDDISYLLEGAECVEPGGGRQAVQYDKDHVPTYKIIMIKSIVNA